MDLKGKIKQLAKEQTTDTIRNRNHLHAHPELSFQEYETAKFVANQLKSLGLTVQEGVAGTGVVAFIEGNEPSANVLALRADMDALPIKEENNVPYKSKNEGVMHACGHDVHTSSLLGAAKILTQLRGSFNGTIKLIFQPGEERSPGGASLMIKDGVLKNPSPNGIIGQHVMPQLPVGKIGFREGKYMASADEIYFTVKGKGGHAAMPELFTDPVLITSHLIVALQQIVSRHANPRIPSVLSFGSIIAEGATNVIPDKVEVAGTFRTFDETWRAEAKEKLINIAKGLVEGMGGEIDIHIADGYPYLVNDPKMTRATRKAAEAYMGTENVVDLDLWMAAEDFAFYSQHTDACFYRLGTRNEEKGIVSGVHTPTFNIDETALEIGPGLMAWLAIQQLQQT